MRTGLIAPVALVLAACSAFAPPPLAPGQTEVQLQGLLGAPTARYPMEGGVTRLEFASGPYGRQTWMVDLGADGRSLRFDQVLNTRHFADFAGRAPGMGVDQLLRELGRPGERQHGGLKGGEVWSWRYPTNDCLWFQVSIGADRKVLGGGYGTDPLCDVKDTTR